MEILHRKSLSETIVKKCHSHKNRLWIASPYIGGLKSVGGILGNKFKGNDLKILVDSSNPFNCDYITINWLLENNFQVRSLPMLHAKIYIIDDESFITSANLSENAFRRRSEVGILLSSKQIKEVENVFKKYWSEGIVVDKFSETKIKSQRRKYKRPGESNGKGKGVPTFYDIPKFHKIQGWLKISGLPDITHREEIFDVDTSKNESFLGCKKNGKPGLNENDIVILSRMGMNGDEKDHFIWGRAKVDIPYRDKRDDIRTYKRFINDKLPNYDKILESMNRWSYGFWIKDLEIIKGGEINFIWLSELMKERKMLIKPESLKQQSHIKLSQDKLDLINGKLNKKFSKFGKIKSNPQEIWINRYISKVSNKIIKNNIK